jgi:lipopolysaccharide/colanic/teichoic acid biosynthesis glycosyltransferase
MMQTNRTRWVVLLGDFGLATLLLILTLPLMAIVALSIKLDSSGPVLDRQKRIGLSGCRYNTLNFRTMVHDSERDIRGAQRDAHFTRVGWFLWYTRLEKLPQLINVLSGDMSCVADTPQRPHFLA